MDNHHGCPLCGRADVPMYRFACPRCFRAMPCPMRHHAVAAWKFRISEPVQYSEVLITVLQWHRGRTNRREEGRGNG